MIRYHEVCYVIVSSQYCDYTIYDDSREMTYVDLIMKPRIISETYKVSYHEQFIGFYYIWDDQTVSFINYTGVSAEIAEEDQRPERNSIQQRTADG